MKPWKKTLFTTTEMLKTTTRDKSSDFSILVFNPFHHADEEDDYNQIEYRLDSSGLFATIVHVKKTDF